MNIRRQKASENVLLVSIHCWLPLGTVDPMMLSYLLLVAAAFYNRWGVIGQRKVTEVLNRVRLHANALLR